MMMRDQRIGITTKWVLHIKATVRPYAIWIEKISALALFLTSECSIEIWRSRIFFLILQQTPAAPGIVQHRIGIPQTTRLDRVVWIEEPRGPWWGVG